MPDATGKKLLHLLKADQPGPLRRAAVLVLGEVGGKDKDLAEVLCAVLDDPDADVRAEAVTAVGKLRIERALSQLLARVKLGGPEAETAAQTAAKLGARGIRGLQSMMSEVAPGLRRRIASALAAGGTASAETAAVDALLDTDPGVVDAAVRTLIGEVPTLGEAQRRAIADSILEHLQAKKGKHLVPASEAALVRLLSALGDPRGEPIYWARIEAPHPPDLRAAALKALGALPPPSGSMALKRLLACAGERDFRVAAPALMILKSLSVTAKNLREWFSLFQSPDVAARRFVIEKLSDHDNAEVAAGLVPQLKHPDRALRDDAMKALARLEHGREALADELLNVESIDEIWSLARAQAALARDYSSSVRTKLFAKACTYLEGEDRRAEALLFLLREADAKDLRDRLAERAVALRKKKQYAAALHYLRLLGRDPACGEATRFELSACGLKVSHHDLAADARAADPCLHQLARLIHSHDIDPLRYVEKATWLAPEELFYLGFHFVEGTGAERDFGGNVLRMVMKKAGRSQLGKDAKSKLRSAGMN